MEQVAALSTSSLRMADTDRGQRCCFYCIRVGHIQRVSLLPPKRRRSPLLHMQQARSLGQGVSAGKRPRGACQRQQAPTASTVSLHRSVVTVATTKSKAATVWGELGDAKADVMLDSGSSVSLVWKQMLSRILSVSTAVQGI